MNPGFVKKSKRKAKIRNTWETYGNILKLDQLKGLIQRPKMAKVHVLEALASSTVKMTPRITANLDNQGLRRLRFNLFKTIRKFVVSSSKQLLCPGFTRSRYGSSDPICSYGGWLHCPSASALNLCTLASCFQAECPYKYSYNMKKAWFVGCYVNTHWWPIQICHKSSL